MHLLSSEAKKVKLNRVKKVKIGVGYLSALGKKNSSREIT
jgi:hypothetical protein